MKSTQDNIEHRQNIILSLAVVEKPSFVYKTGKIRGSLCRYELRAWIRERSGVHVGIVVMYHDGQSPSVCAIGELCELYKSYRTTDAEGSAISSMLNSAMQDCNRVLIAA